MADSYDRKSALIAELAAQRTQLSRHASRLKESADIGARLRASFAGHRAGWLAGATLTGVILARLRPGRKKVRTVRGSAPAQTAARAGFGLALLKIIFDLVRPALVSMVTARVANFAAGRSAAPRPRY